MTCPLLSIRAIQKPKQMGQSSSSVRTIGRWSLLRSLSDSELFTTKYTRYACASESIKTSCQPLICLRLKAYDNLFGGPIDQYRVLILAGNLLDSGCADRIS